jgi:heme/copper-type cytochrome/quinol oxidase subunit 2
MLPTQPSPLADILNVIALLAIVAIVVVVIGAFLLVDWRNKRKVERQLRDWNASCSILRRRAEIQEVQKPSRERPKAS